MSLQGDVLRFLNRSAHHRRHHAVGDAPDAVLMTLHLAKVDAYLDCAN
jgi:hypothetical protein